MKTAAVCALCLIACSAGRDDAQRPGSVPPVPVPTVLPRPVDLTTAFGRDARPGLDIRHYTLPIGPSLETLAARVSLKTWPEFAPVPSSIAAHDVVPTPGAIEDASIEVIPSVPLENRWYALVIDTVPPGFELPSAEPRVTFGGAAFISRFRTSSGPFVVAAKLCDDPVSRQMRVTLALSELVLASAKTIAEAVTISQTGHPDLRCTVQANVPPSMWGTLTHLCAGVDPATPLSISVVPSLASVTGKPIAPFSATLLRGDLVLEQTDVSCNVFRPWSAAAAPLP